MITNRKGSGLVEVIIAIAILSLGLSSAILLAFANQSLKISSITNNEALGKAEILIEKARADASEDFSSVVSMSPLADDIYMKSLDVVDIDIFTKEVTSNVSWTGEHGEALAIELVTLLTDPESVLGGDTCTEEVTGDWTNPERFGYGDITSDDGATGLDAFNHRVYLTTTPSGPPQHDFYIFDVSDPNPAGPPAGKLPILSSLDTGYGLEDVRVAGRFVYVVAADTFTVQLVVIDAIDVINPLVISEFDATPVGITGYGNTLAYADSKVYLGLTKSTGPEMYVIDVSDPLNPATVGTLETNTAINQIVIDRDNDIAYIALADPLAGQLWKVDISDPTNPTVLQKFFPGTANWVGQGVALSKTTTDIFLGRIYDVGANDVDLYALDSSDLSATPMDTVTQTWDDGFSRMVVRSGLLFASNNQPNLGFQVWDVSDPTNMTMFGSLNIQQASTAGMDCEGNYIFIGQRSNRALQIIGPS